MKLSWENLGWHSRDRNGLILLLQGFVSGIIIVTVLMLSLYLLGIHVPVPGHDYSLQAIVTLIAKAVVTGLLVAVFEETLFRGALLGGLLHRTRNAWTAVITISLVYAAVHFIDYLPLSADETVTWVSGPERFISVLINLFDPATLDAFLALFMLGILLGWMRVRDGHIFRCLGLHAGLVAMIKISRYFFTYQEGSRFDFLVSSHDHRLGYLAFMWLLFATLVYYTYGKAKNPVID